MKPHRNPIFAVAFLVLCGHSCLVCCQQGHTTSSEHNDGTTRAIYSARLDYNNVWTPMGHGDPLKKDPTYDYSPPVLDRVRYWADSAAEATSTNEEATSQQHYQHPAAYQNQPQHHSHSVAKPKSDILLLGVHAKRPQFKSVDSGSGSHAMRRNYFPQLPTVLMPPPMQTLDPHRSGQEEMSYQMKGSYAHPEMKWYNHHEDTDHNAESTNAHSQVIQPSTNLLNLHKQVNSLSASSNAIPAFPSSDYVMSNRKKPWIHALLQKEITPPQSSFVSMHAAPSVYESHTQDITPAAFHSTGQTNTRPYHHPNGIESSERWETTTHFSPTTHPDTQAMTTDSLFSHYNQPKKPLPGPMYLIIEGHSKVKNYGGSSNSSKSHEPKFVPVQSTIDPVAVRVVSEDDDGKRFEVRHLHYKQPTLEEIEAQTEQSVTTKAPSSQGMSNLLSLLDTSFGDFFSAHEVTTITTVPMETAATSNEPSTTTPSSETSQNVTDASKEVDDNAANLELNATTSITPI